MLLNDFQHDVKICMVLFKGKGERKQMIDFSSLCILIKS